MDSVPVANQVGKPEIHRAKHSAPRSPRPAALRDERGAQEGADDGGCATTDCTVLARADDAKGEPGAYIRYGGRSEILQGEVDPECFPGIIRFRDVPRRDLVGIQHQVPGVLGGAPELRGSSRECALRSAPRPPRTPDPLLGAEVFGHSTGTG